MDIDFHTATWHQVARWAQLRIERLRTQLEGDLDPTQTASLRGQIRALKTLLGLPEEARRAKETETAD